MHGEAASHSAEVLDEREPAQAVRLAQLRDAGALVLDHSASQIEALTALAEPFDGDPTDTRWVHYPWRSTLVRLLAPAGFRRLRLDRNRNKITNDEQQRAGALSIGVVGLSVGHAVAHTLALEGLCGRLRLADFDHLELSNLNRVPATVFDLGVNKAVVAARRIAELDPYLVVEVEPRGITEDTLGAFLDGLDLVAEECDSFDAKVLVRDRARAAGIPVIMETSDGGVLDVERFDLEPGRPLFHGLVGDLDRDALARLTTEQKLPFALEILDGSAITPRMAASALELGRTLSAWPQTGGDVALGGASVAAAVRRLVRRQPLPSGRIRVDLDVALDGLGSSDHSTTAGPRASGSAPPVPARPHVDPRQAARGTGAVNTVLHAASRAPSLGNMQPWRFRLVDASLEVRPAPVADSPVDLARRATMIGVGAAWFSAAVAARAVGLKGTTGLRGDAGDPRVVVDLTAAETEGEAALHALLARHTSRAPGAGSPLTVAELDAVRGRPLVEGPLEGPPPRVVLLHDPAELAALAEILGRAERLRFLTPRLHADWVALHPRDPEPVGVPDSERALAPPQVPLQTIFRRPDVMDHLREWDAGQALGADVAARAGSASVAAVILAPDGSALAHLGSGWAATDLWVRANGAGVAVHPMTPVFLHAGSRTDLSALAPGHSEELTDLADRFRALTRATVHEVPAVLLLLSHAQSSSHAPAPGPVSLRRPVEDLTD
ncbi:Rv1355c family protein [Rhodococcus sp. IEGM 1408]|uniref:Rv1355c family protein n=1 Tax=Rhodococcus sp. IEGM 1408 TaxID=3082220 RepID=UPI002953DE8D|nr:Rv1355c family protein [Rhodococcus sp. IEGM 1408]MDV7999975.1 Rv1355c family protein [Rhodococcus sp. IEGM 1408]